MRLSEARRRCLEWYREAEHDPERIIPSDARWNMRQVNDLLEMGMLTVGPGGWHVPSEAGRRALDEAEQ